MNIRSKTVCLTEKRTYLCNVSTPLEDILFTLISNHDCMKNIPELHFAFTDTGKPGTNFILHYVQMSYIHHLKYHIHYIYHHSESLHFSHRA